VPMPDLLVEIGCEELPAAACREARAQLPGVLAGALERARLTAAETAVHVAPRRLAVIARGLPDAAAGERLHRRGPRLDAAEQARAGFTRSAPPFARVVEREGFLWIEGEAPSTPVTELIPALVSEIAGGVRFRSSMRWDGGRFSRPVRWLAVCLDGAPAAGSAFGLDAGSTSRGHRVLGGPVELSGAAAYLDELRASCVLADAGERRAAIVAGLDGLGGWDDPAGKLDEVVDLVEWPVVLAGGFDRRYLELPERVIVTAMQSHQRYFPLRGDGGTLEPRFAFVANGAPDPDLIVHGNEAVLAGRLEDAAFAIGRDRERGIEAMAEELARVSFLEGSGSLADKCERMSVLADRLAVQNELTPAQTATIARAVELAKADLVSGLVSEFPDLQGFAGALYAADADEDAAVAEAIGEHHRPTEAGGETPETVAGAIVALADKLDTVGVAFALGLQPTGSRDPYGLRRAAAGIVAIVLERGLELRLEALFEVVIGNLDAAGTRVTREMRESAPRAVGFVLDRVDAALLDEGVPVEEVRCARGSGEDEPAALAALARALRDAGRERLEPLRAAYARCVRIAASGPAGESPVEPSAFTDPAERELAEAIEAVDEAIAECVAVGDHAGALVAAAELVPSINRFFEDVLVMAEDPVVRANRLRLVGEAASTLRTLGDFAQLPG